MTEGKEIYPQFPSWSQSFDLLPPDVQRIINEHCRNIRGRLVREDKWTNDKDGLQLIREYALDHPESYPEYAQWLWTQILKLN